MRRVLVAVGLGIVGVALALGLTIGTLAIAGPDVGSLPTPPILGPSHEPSPAGDTSGTGRQGDGREDKGTNHGGESPGASPSASGGHEGSNQSPTSDPSGGSHDGQSSEDTSHDGSGSGSEEHEEPDDD